MAFNVWSIKMPRIQYVFISRIRHARLSFLAKRQILLASITHFYGFLLTLLVQFLVPVDLLCIASTPDEKVIKMYSMQDCFNYCMFSADFLVSFLLR